MAVRVERLGTGGTECGIIASAREVPRKATVGGERGHCALCSSQCSMCPTQCPMLTPVGCSKAYLVSWTGLLPFLDAPMRTSGRGQGGALLRASPGSRNVALTGLACKASSALRLNWVDNEASCAVGTLPQPVQRRIRYRPCISCTASSTISFTTTTLKADRALSAFVLGQNVYGLFATLSPDLQARCAADRHDCIIVY